MLYPPGGFWEVVFLLPKKLSWMSPTAWIQLISLVLGDLLGFRVTEQISLSVLWMLLSLTLDSASFHQTVMPLGFWVPTGLTTLQPGSPSQVVLGVLAAAMAVVVVAGVVALIEFFVVVVEMTVRKFFVVVESTVRKFFVAESTVRLSHL